MESDIERVNNDTTTVDATAQLVYSFVTIGMMLFASKFLPGIARYMYVFCYYRTETHVAQKIGQEGVDPDFVSEEDLLRRKVWVDDTLITYKDAGYQLDSCGFPVNPYAKTGKKGRWSMNRFGPNHEVYLVITAKYNDQYKVLVCNNSTTQPSLPFSTVNTDVETHTSKIQSTVCYQVLEHPEMFEDKISKAKLFFSGYSHDYVLSTDTSWIEIGAFHVHLEDEEVEQLHLKDTHSFWYILEETNIMMSPLSDVHMELVDLAIAFH
mgnify:CR=1 FL=1